MIDTLISTFEVESILDKISIEFPISKKRKNSKSPCSIEFHEGPLEIPEGTIIIY